MLEKFLKKMQFVKVMGVRNSLLFSTTCVLLIEYICMFSCACYILSMLQQHRLLASEQKVGIFEVVVNLVFMALLLIFHYWCKAGKNYSLRGTWDALLLFYIPCTLELFKVDILNDMEVFGEQFGVSQSTVLGAFSIILVVAVFLLMVDGMRGCVVTLKQIFLDYYEVTEKRVEKVETGILLGDRLILGEVEENKVIK